VTAVPLRARLLVVEDDPDVGEALSLLLEDAGYSVELVRTGAEALAACRSRPPELALVDVSLPGGMDGLELTRALGDDPRTREVPILLVSARAHEDDVAAGLAAGARAYVVKPFRPDRLISLVATTVVGQGQAHLEHGPDAD
jgi:CheY-like chemotaxis protein